MKGLSKEEVEEILTFDNNSDDEIYGILFSNGESKDCLTIEQAIQEQFDHGGEIYSIK
jgi:hypothetical protein